MRSGMKRWLTIMVAVSCVTGISADVYANETADIWKIDESIARAMDEKNTADVAKLNEEIRAVCPSIVDLDAISEEMDGQWVREQIAMYQLPEGELFSRGKAVTTEGRQKLMDNRNLTPIGKTQPIGYGVAVRRANVKAVPYAGGMFAMADDMDKDVLQQGALDPCEAVRLLHVSQDRRYYFVQGETVKGWVFVGDIAVCKNSVWQKFYDPTEALVVCTRGIRIKHGRETVYAQMGARLPIVSVSDTQYKVQMPIRGNGGKLTDTEVLLDKTDEVQIGYQDYQKDNLSKLARAYVDAPYGYHGLKNSEDIIGMTADVYRVMGITLPRDEADYAKAIAIVGRVGDAYPAQSADGTSYLVLSQEGNQLTVIGQNADGKQIGEYTIEQNAIEGMAK